MSFGRTGLTEVDFVSIGESPLCRPLGTSTPSLIHPKLHPRLRRCSSGLGLLEFLVLLCCRGLTGIHWHANRLSRRQPPPPRSPEQKSTKSACSEGRPACEELLCCNLPEVPRKFSIRVMRGSFGANQTTMDAYCDIRRGLDEIPKAGECKRSLVFVAAQPEVHK